MVPLKNRGRKRRKNPAFPGVKALGVNIARAFTDALVVGVGIYGSRYLTRAVLGQRDAGVLGYGTTALSGVALAAGARMVGASAEIGQKIAAGSMVALLGRGVVDVAKRVGASGPLVAGFSDYMDTGYQGPYVESGTGTRLGLPELDIDEDGMGSAAFAEYLTD